MTLEEAIKARHSVRNYKHQQAFLLFLCGGAKFWFEKNTE